MYFSTPLTTAIATLYTLSTLPLTIATCASYTETVRFNSVSLPSLTNIRISRGYACTTSSSPEECSARGEDMEINLLPQFNSTSLREETYSALYDLLRPNLTIIGAWREYMRGTLPGAAVSFPLNASQEAEWRSGYIAWTPYYDCTQGYVQECSEGFEVQDRDQVMLCVPSTRGNIPGVFFGAMDWVRLGEEEVVGIKEDVPSVFTQEGGEGRASDPIEIEGDEEVSGNDEDDTSGGMRVQQSGLIWPMAAVALLVVASV